MFRLLIEIEQVSKSEPHAKGLAATMQTHVKTHKDNDKATHHEKEMAARIARQIEAYIKITEALQEANSTEEAMQVFMKLMAGDLVDKSAGVKVEDFGDSMSEPEALVTKPRFEHGKN